jgi:hypothetical protein
MISEKVFRIEGPVTSRVIHVSPVRAAPDLVHEHLVGAFPKSAH